MTLVGSGSHRPLRQLPHNGSSWQGSNGIRILRSDHVLVELLATFAAFDERRYQRWLHASLHAFDSLPDFALTETI